MAIIAPGCGGSDSAIAMYVAAPSGLVVRSAASQNSERLGAVPYGTQVQVIGQAEREETIGGKTGRWVRIRFEGAGTREAWVFGGYLTASVPGDPAGAAPGHEERAPLVRSLVAGDVACYVELDYGTETRTHHADWAICERPLQGKRIRFTTEKQKVIAASCEGNPECEEHELVDLIVTVEVQ